MGVCINHELGQYRPYIKDTLDAVEAHAETIKENVVEGVEIKLNRISEHSLFIDVTGCETLCFEFKSVHEIEADGLREWNYEHAVLTDGGKHKLDGGYEPENFPQNEKWYCASGTKTQFAGNVIAHKVIADLIKIAASRCFFAHVNDEGDYYHSGNLGHAISSIRENGAMIDGLTKSLVGAGWKKTNIIKGGSTKIGN